MNRGSRKVTKEELEAAVAKSSTIQEVGLSLGFNPGGSLYSRVKGLALHYEVDLPKFDYKSNAVRLRKTNRIPDDEYFVKNSEHNGAEVRKRLFALGRENKCAGIDCPLPEAVWRGVPLTLHVEHKDGDHFNNLLENLEFLCPNCHQQSATWGNKKRLKD